MSSFVNKSGKSFAPTKAVRRRPRPATPPKEVVPPPSPQQDAIVQDPTIPQIPQDAESRSETGKQGNAPTQGLEPSTDLSARTAHTGLQVMQTIEKDGTLVIETDAPIAVAEEIVSALEPALKRRKVQSRSPAPRISVSRQTRSVSSCSSVPPHTEVQVNIEPDAASVDARVTLTPAHSSPGETAPVTEHIRIEIPTSKPSSSLSPTLRRTTRQQTARKAIPSEEAQPASTASPTRRRNPITAAATMATPSTGLDTIAESVEKIAVHEKTSKAPKGARKAKKTDKETEQIERVPRPGSPQVIVTVEKPAKRKASATEKGSSAKKAKTQILDSTDGPSMITLTPENYGAVLAKKQRRRDKGIPRKAPANRRPAVETEGNVFGPEYAEQVTQHDGSTDDLTENVIESTESALPRDDGTGPALSARQRNAERRKQKAAEREAKARGPMAARNTAAPIGLTVEGLEKDVPVPENAEPPMTSREAILARAKAKAKTSRQKGDKDRTQTAANGEEENGDPDRENEEIGSDTAGNKARTRPIRQRRATPDGSEEVTIVDSMITMSELATRNVRTGKKSEREKLMAQIDWDDVKRKRKESLEKLARNKGRRASQSESPEPAAGTNGVDEEIDEDDIDAQIERAAAKGSRRQKGVQMREVDGEHFIDETTLVIDRHALANEDMEELEEIEEDDLTRHFNSQTYQCLRRKEPAERVRNWDRWTTDLTDKFYDYLSQFGTDFMIISHLFPGRTRREIKSKFVREERLDPERVRAALSGSLIAAPDTWNLDEYRMAAGLEPHQMRDPAELEASLAARRKEREKEIEEARRVQAEILRQKKLAGVESSDEEEEDGGGGGDDDGGITAPKKKKTKKKETKRRGKKNQAVGGEAEVMEEYAEDE